MSAVLFVILIIFLLSFTALKGEFSWLYDSFFSPYAFSNNDFISRWLLPPRRGWGVRRQIPAPPSKLGPCGAELSEVLEPALLAVTQASPVSMTLAVNAVLVSLTLVMHS